MLWAARPSAAPGRCGLRFSSPCPLMVGGVGVQVWGWLTTDLRPSENSYSAVVYTFAAWQGFFAAVLTIMALFTLARSLAGRLNRARRATFDNTALLWHYASVQALIGLALVHGFPQALR